MLLALYRMERLFYNQNTSERHPACVLSSLGMTHHEPGPQMKGPQFRAWRPTRITNTAFTGKHARSILADVSALRQTAQQNGARAEGRLRVGVVASIACGFSRHLLASFVCDRPGLELEVVEGSPRENIAAVPALILDLAFVAGMSLSPGCELEELWREHVMVGLPEDHHLAEAKLIFWEQLAHERLIVSRVDPGPEIQNYIIYGLADLGKHPNVDRLSVRRETLLALVALKQGLSLVGEAEAGVTYPGVVFRPLAHEELPFSLAWSITNDNPAFRRFLSSARLRTAERRAARPMP